MKGSTRKRNGKWSYRIDLGMIDGKRKQSERGGFNTEKEAERAMTDAMYSINTNGRFIENKKITFQQLFEDFITTEAPLNRKYATIVRYRSIYNNHFVEFNFRF